jgi:hypothetical protein
LTVARSCSAKLIREQGPEKGEAKKREGGGMKEEMKWK